jgi:intracellular multiplication protein IcmE
MADLKINLSNLFSDSRSRIIILVSLVFAVGVLLFGAINLFSSDVDSSEDGSALSSAPAIESIPGSVNPTEQYAKLQEQENVEKARRAKETGASSIPTIIRTEKFGSGNAPIGLQEGEGGVGFSTLALGGDSGRKLTWLDDLKNSQCAKAEVDSAMTRGATTEELLTVCSCIQLKAHGFRLTELVNNCSCKGLKEAGYTAKELKELGGYTAKQLRICGYSACAMKAAGFTAAELKSAGYSDGELKGAGFFDEEIKAASGLPPGVTVDDIKKAGCDPANLRRLKAKGVSAAAIRRISGCSVDQLKSAGFSPQELKEAGFTAAELRAAGFTAEELKDAGFSVKELKNAGFSAKELKDAGFSDNELRSAGFSEAEIQAANAGSVYRSSDEDSVLPKDCSVSAIQKARADGVSAKEIREKMGCNVKALKAAGFRAEELKEAGFTAAELKTAGFSARDLREAGFGAAELKEAGFSAAELKDSGFSARELKNAGFSAAELKSAGFSAAALKDAGFSANELKAAGFSAAELKAAGFSAEELKNAGFSAEELKAAGFSAEELKNAGFSAEELLKAGFSKDELLKAGYSKDQIQDDDLDDSEFSFIEDEELRKALAKSKTKRDKSQLAGQLKKISSSMKGYASKLSKSWRVSDQEFVNDEDDEEGIGAGIGGAIKKATGAGGGAAGVDDAGVGQPPAMIKAGDIHFAVLQTTINTDEPGPILAKVAQGKFKGSKLIGSVTLPNNGQKAILKFTRMSVPGLDNTITIDSVAIDLNTARTALSSRTDNHYLTRYGSLLASSFLEGFGKAITGVQTQISTTGGILETTSATQTAGEALYAGLGTVGERWGDAIGTYVDRQPTVHIYSGVGMGILFLQDVAQVI